MKFFSRKNKVAAAAPDPAPKIDEDWTDLPAYIPADQQDIPVVSLIATAIALGDRPDGSFTVKKVWQRNPEAELVSVIATAATVGTGTNSVKITKIRKRK